MITQYPDSFWDAFRDDLERLAREGMRERAAADKLVHEDTIPTEPESDMERDRR